jgi:hypothetical protein
MEVRKSTFSKEASKGLDYDSLFSETLFEN